MNLSRISITTPRLFMAARDGRIDQNMMNAFEAGRDGCLWHLKRELDEPSINEERQKELIGEYLRGITQERNVRVAGDLRSAVINAVLKHKDKISEEADNTFVIAVQGEFQSLPQLPGFYTLAGVKGFIQELDSKFWI